MRFIIRKFFFAISAAVVMSLTLAGPTKATVLTFTDVTAFDTAVAGIAGIDPKVIDFESFTGGTEIITGDIIASGSTHQGVTFTPTLFLDFDLAIRGIGGTSGVNTLGASNDGGTSVAQLSLGDVIDFAFTDPTNAFGFFVIVSPSFSFFGDDVTLFAADDSRSSPMGMSGTPSTCGIAPCDVLFLGIVDTDATFTSASVQFGPTTGSSRLPFFELDDLMFTMPSSGGDDGGDDGGQDVPEPGTLALFGLGLLGLGLTRRRRKRA